MWFITPPPAPACAEDEVAVMYLPGEDFEPGQRATTCVPFDSLLSGWGTPVPERTVVHPAYCEAIEDGYLDCWVDPYALEPGDEKTPWS